MTQLPDSACPCGSQKNYLSCCKPFLTGQQIPETPQALMRSRYTAYTMANIAYIKDTMRGSALLGFREAEAKRWATNVRWIKLLVLASSMEHASTGYVEFEAYFVDGYRLKALHEKSKFLWEEGRWYYVGGTHLPPTIAEQKISRTMTCPCGSLRKFKNCHGR